MPRPYMANYPGYGFQDPQYGGPQMQGSSPMQGVEMQYQQPYLAEGLRQPQVQASPGQQQPPTQQQYSQYATPSMLPPVGQQSLFDSPYGARQAQAAAVEVMASQFQMPQYMPQSEHSPPTLGSSHPQYITSQPEQSGYGQVAVSRPAIPQAYAAGPVDYAMAEPTGAAEASAQGNAQDALNEGLRDYHVQLRAVFDAIIVGRVTLASEKLLEISRWLVNSVTALGKPIVTSEGRGVS
jgi:hypothetical protein